MVPESCLEFVGCNPDVCFRFVIVSCCYFNYVIISRTNVASVGSVYNDTRKVKVLSLPETIKEKSTFRAKALRRDLETRVQWRGLGKIHLTEIAGAFGC